MKSKEQLNELELEINAYQRKDGKAPKDTKSASLASLLKNRDDRRLNVPLRGTLYRNFQILCMLDRRSITDVTNEIVHDYVQQNMDRLLKAFMDDLNP